MHVRLRLPGRLTFYAAFLGTGTARLFGPECGLVRFRYILSVLTLGAALSSGTPAAEAGSCYSVWAEAQPMGSHYRHVVYVENDCDDWLQCSLWTDVNPQPPKMVSVGPGMTESAETNGRSDVDDPKGFASCRKK